MTWQRMANRPSLTLDLSTFLIRRTYAAFQTRGLIVFRGHGWTCGRKDSPKSYHIIGLAASSASYLFMYYNHFPGGRNTGFSGATVACPVGSVGRRIRILMVILGFLRESVPLWAGLLSAACALGYFSLLNTYLLFPTSF